MPQIGRPIEPGFLASSSVLKLATGDGEDLWLELRGVYRLEQLRVELVGEEHHDLAGWVVGYVPKRIVLNDLRQFGAGAHEYPNVSPELRCQCLLDLGLGSCRGGAGS